VPAGQLTLQQRFDRAVELTRTGDCINAVAQFEDLKSQPAFKTGTLANSMLLMHQGRCLVDIGLADLGEKYIGQAMPGLRKAGQFDIDIAAGLTSLGDAAMARWDNASAKARYLEARAMDNAIDRATIDMKLAKATAFDGGPEPLQYIEEAIRLTEADGKISKNNIAALRTIRGRILLNQGNNKDAYAELKKALSLTGGLDLKVDLADIALRSDLAVAAQLSGDNEGAREYLAYTGAGRLSEKNLNSGISMEPPVCGSETGLRPEDFAIVEFSIGESGRVLRADTVFSRGNAQVAGAFSRAVSNWAWDPEVIKATPAVFRFATHIELRCTTLGQQVPNALSPLSVRLMTWAPKALGMDQDSLTIDAALKDKLKAMAEDPANDGVKRTAANSLLLFTQSLGEAEAARRYADLLAMATAANAPQDVINSFKILYTFNRVSASDEAKGTSLTASLLALLNEPGMADDALSASTVRILASQGGRRNRPPPERPLLLQTVAGENRLPPHHPLRQLANLTLANDAAKDKNFAEADRFFKATGLTEEQCALIGPKPAISHVGLSSNSYPQEALFQNFEGWLRLEYDIEADGKPAGVRPIIAYPPFIFNAASVRGIQASRYEPSYRPSGGAACSASRQGINFHMGS